MLRLEGLVRHFDGVRAVDNVSFSVERGKVLGFIGPNGAGKTTTMRILATLDMPQQGDAFVGGYSVLRQPRDVRQITGFMPDYAGVYALTTVEEYLDFFARSYGLRGPARRTGGMSVREPAARIRPAFSILPGPPADATALRRL
jgi:ABC-2 type transport system ATP-binding protein